MIIFDLNSPLLYLKATVLHNFGNDTAYFYISQKLTQNVQKRI